MEITDLKVYDMEECISASGFPMRTKAEILPIEEKDIVRIKNLTKASNGNPAHAQFLSGILVAFNLKCSNKMWVEMERYKYIVFDSSQSTMHRICKFNVKEQCVEEVDDRIIEVVQEKIDAYNADPTIENYRKVLYNVPSGFQLTARLNTNYRCLLNIYVQRHNHRLKEWQDFCQYLLDNLPMFKEFVEAYYSHDKEIISKYIQYCMGQPDEIDVFEQKTLDDYFDGLFPELNNN